MNTNRHHRIRKADAVNRRTITKVVRRLITDHLSAEFQTDHRNIQSALKALRLSTRQALHEGWLPA